MSIFRKPKVLTLSEWLQIATRKLSQPAKDRIRTEIEAHYAQAVEAHRENGLSEYEPHKAALAELGDARAAGKRFRKQHLTEREAQWVTSMTEKGGALLCWYLIVCFSGFLQSTEYGRMVQRIIVIGCFP